LLIFLLPICANLSWYGTFVFDKVLDQVMFYWGKTIIGIAVTPWQYPLWGMILYISISGVYRVYFKDEEKMSGTRFLVTQLSCILLLILPMVFYRFGFIPYVGE